MNSCFVIFKFFMIFGINLRNFCRESRYSRFHLSDFDVLQKEEAFDLSKERESEIRSRVKSYVSLAILHYIRMNSNYSHRTIR